MRRSTLILIIVSVVVIIGGGTYVWLKKDTLNFPWVSNANTAATTNSDSVAVNNVPTNTAPIIITLPTEVKGDVAASGSLKVGDVTITISSQQKQTTADGKTAEKGQTLLLVFFDALEPTQVEAVDAGLRGVTVSDGKTSYPLAGLIVASTNVKGSRGYMRFSIPDTAKNLVVQLGTGDTAQTVKLP
jgi:hypothetical protein